MKTARIAWIGVPATFAIVGLSAAHEGLLLSRALGTNFHGRDLRSLCAFFTALAEGKDPYIVANIRGGDLTLPNAIVTAYPAKFLCPIHAVWPKAYVIIYLLFSVCSCAALTDLLLRDVVETALVAIVSICAFAAFHWLAITGNIAIFEMPFAVLTILAVHQQRFVVGWRRPRIDEQFEDPASCGCACILDPSDRVGTEGARSRGFVADV